MKITLLGTGTSHGIPVMGCQCKVCQSADPRDKRLRTTALVETDSTCVLIDCGPDFRQQMLSIGMARDIDGCLITHEHYDHVGGIDDLRPFSYRQKLTLYADDYAATHLEQRLPYCLVRNVYPGVPQLELKRIAPLDHFQIGDIPVTALKVMHGDLPILGYRLGDMAFITDMKTMPEEEWELLKGVKLLIVNALRFKPHRTHQSIEEAIEFAQRVGAQETYLTHMCHDAGLHAETDAALPAGIHLAYDGLCLELLDEETGSHVEVHSK